MFGEGKVARKWDECITNIQINRVGFTDRLRVYCVFTTAQGDGTAAMCAGNPGIFTLSVHAANNFPARKQQSSLDVGLADGVGDEGYLATVAEVRAASVASVPDSRKQCLRGYCTDV